MYGASPPNFYDPRCKDWYINQHKKTHTTFSDVYKFASSGKLGITNCIPLWVTPGNDVGNLKEQFYGAYCLD